jgi:GT2 family glycosyltransferase
MSEGRPSVLVLLVATNGRPWLADAIAGIQAQTWDDLDVLAVDNHSTDGSRALLRAAFGDERIVTLDRRVGYGRALAAALKVVADRRIEADAFLLLHDDVAMDPTCVEAMVAALARERVGIVGAKLVEWDDPGVLQEVGLTTDRYGRLFNPLERGELDQGQHDGLREVLFASSACLLVLRRVVEEVGLFDLRYVAMRDDLDFCWRARLAGFRSVVTGAARARHALASYRDLRPGPVGGHTRYFGERNMIASLLKNYSLPSLALALPVTLLGSLLAAVLFLATGRRRAARQTLAALQWNVAHLPSTLRARARAQRVRRAPDREITCLMARGAPRLRSYLERTLEQVVGEPAEGLGQEEAPAAPRRRLVDLARAHPAGLALGALALLYLIGVRTLLGGGGIAGLDLAPFPSTPGAFFQEFFSGWRSAGVGGAAPATPALFLGGVLSLVLFGSARLAERAVVLGLPPLAALTAWRLAGALGLPPRARRAATIAYALSPLVLTAFSHGRLPDLLLAAALPALLLPVVRAAGLAPAAGWRSPAAGAIGLAAVASASPWALVGLLGSGGALAAGLLLAGDRGGARRAALTAGVLTVGALVLLLPWSVELFRPGSPIGAPSGPLAAPFTDLLRLVPARPSAVPLALAWAFPLAAASAPLVAPAAGRERLSLVLAVAGVLGLGAAWAVARGVPWIAPRPGLPLTLAAVVAAMLAGVAAEGIVPALRARPFGAWHVGLGVVACFGAVSAAAGLALVVRGDFAGLRRAADAVPSFFASDRGRLGDFRVLWVSGETRALRADVTGPEGETILALGARRAGPGDRALASALAATLGGETDQAGRLLVPLGVRYVVLRPGTAPEVAEAFARQSDIRFSQRFRSSRVLSNDAWLAVAAGVSSPEWVAAAGPPASAPLDPGRVGALRRLGPGRFAGTLGPGATRLLLAETFSRAWRARVAGRELRPERSFGFATAFGLPPGEGARRVTVTWRGQARHRLALAGWAGILLLAASLWSRQASRERGER